MPRLLLLSVLACVALLPTLASAQSASPYTILDEQAGERAGSATVTVRRENATGPQTLRLATTGGTASPEVDFMPTSSPGALIEFVAGQQSATAEVGVLDDAEDEPDETVGLVLTDSAAPEPPLATGTLTILDDDPTTQTVTQTTTTPAPTPPPEPKRPTIRVIPDTTPPVALVVSKAVKSRTIRSNGVTLLYSCNEACKVTATLKIGTRTIASGRSELRAPGIKRFRVRLSAAGRRAVRAGRNYRVRLSARVADVRRNAATSTSAFSIVR